MKRTIVFTFMAALAISGCDNSKGNKIHSDSKLSSVCSDDCIAKNNSTDLSCKLTSDELQKRKVTVLESLRKQIIEKKELESGYAFKFNGTDTILDELTEFIKTERECCNFFTFNLSISGDKNEIWLELTGPKEAKEFIQAELEL